MDPNAFTLIVQFQARPDKVDTLRGALLHITEQTRKESGNIHYDLHESTTQPGHFIICESWKDQAAHDAHMQEPYLKEFLSRAESLMDGSIPGIRCRKL